jgi:hypothetical protein
MSRHLSSPPCAYSGAGFFSSPKTSSLDGPNLLIRFPRTGAPKIESHSSRSAARDHPLIQPGQIGKYSLLNVWDVRSSAERALKLS